MKLLLLTESLPYPITSDVRLRAYYLLRYLAERCRVTLVCFAGSTTRAEHVSHLEGLGVEVHAVSTAHSGPALRRRTRQIFSSRPTNYHPAEREMTELLTRLLADYSYGALQVQGTSMAHHALAAVRALNRETAPKLLVDAYPVNSRRLTQQAALGGALSRMRWGREADRYRGYERMLCRQADHILTVSAQEKGALLHLLPETEAAAIAEKISVLPIGVDATEMAQPATPAAKSPDASAQILFAGDFRWAHNVLAASWFAGQVLPLVLAELPEARFTIAGAHIPEELIMLPGTGLPGVDRVEVVETGVDLSEQWAVGRVFVAPYQHPQAISVKVLDAWLRAVPVVTTRLAVQGLSIRPGQTNLLADEPFAFAQAVVTLLRDADLASGVARNARHWVERRYDWRVLYQELDEVYGAVMPVAVAHTSDETSD